MTKEEQILEEVGELYRKMAWLNGLKMQPRLKEYKSSEVHCVEYIKKHPDANATKLADAFYMTRGAISKMTKKLIQKGLIQSFQKPENKKEIYFQLTKKGEKVNQIHEKLHAEFHERDKEVFEKVSENQWNGILQFVGNYSAHLDKEIEKLDLKHE